jgi:hypothetical protein
MKAEYQNSPLIKRSIPGRQNSRSRLFAHGRKRFSGKSWCLAQSGSMFFMRFPLRCSPFAARDVAAAGTQKHFGGARLLGVLFGACFTHPHRWRHGLLIGEATVLSRTIRKFFSVSASMKQHAEATLPPKGLRFTQAELHLPGHEVESRSCCMCPRLLGYWTHKFMPTSCDLLRWYQLLLQRGPDNAGFLRL